ncbi:hypothetical protein AKO1_006729 [Acrasis kona]|uniref:Methyltransferase-like protein n=1 Tax=Acrasis kona TaxID=1008807 RepID=A0AAW2ZJW9_9EUKA
MEQKVVRRIEHLNRWLNPDDYKQWIKNDNVVEIKSNSDTNQATRPATNLFPDEGEVFEMVREAQHVTFEHDFGLISTLDGQDKSRILQILTTNKVDVSPWHNIFSQK